MRILAVDPGERVGWAVGEVAGPVGGQLLRVENHGISFLKDFAVKLGQVFHEYDVVIYETFRLRANVARKFAGNDMQTSQLIGIIRYLGWINPQVKVVGQGPAVKATADKTMPSNIQSIIDKAPKNHDDSHDTDALRHLWFWFWERYV